MRKNPLPLAGVALFVLGVWLTAGGCEKIESDTTQADKKVADLVSKAMVSLDDARAKREQADDNAIAANAKLEDAKHSPARDTATGAHDAAVLKGEAATLADKAGKLRKEADRLQAQAAGYLQDAAKDPKVAKSLQASVKAFDAQARCDSALVSLSDVEPLLLDAHRLMWEISQLGARIGVNNAAIAAYDQQNPDNPPSKADGTSPAIAPLKAAADERAKLVAFNTDLDKSIAAQKEKVSAKEAEVKNLADEKTREDATSVDLLRKSEATKGDESMKLFTAGQEAHARAQAAAARLEIASAGLADVQRDLAGLQDQRTANDQAITKLDAQTALVKASWFEVDKARKALMDSSKQILEGSSATTGPSDTIAAKAKELRAILQRIEEKRLVALAQENPAALLNEADSKFEQAAKDADEARKTLNALIQKAEADQSGSQDKQSAPSRRKVLEALKLLNNPSAYRMPRANVFAAKGRIEAGRVQLLSRQVDLLAQLKTVTDAGLTIPADLTAGDPQAALPKAVDRAKAAYNSADEMAKALIEDPEYRTPARTMQMFVWYGLYQVTKDDKYLKDAQSAYKALKATYEQESKVMPAVAADLDQRPLELPKPPVGPTSVPATEPTTAPTDGVPPATAPSGPEGTTPAPDPAPAPAPDPAPAPAPAPDPAPAPPQP